MLGLVLISISCQELLCSLEIILCFVILLDFLCCCEALPAMDDVSIGLDDLTLEIEELINEEQDSLDLALGARVFSN